MSRNDEQIGALERELAGYEKYGRAERAAQVREQIRALGGTVEKVDEPAESGRKGRRRRAAVETADATPPEDTASR